MIWLAANVIVLMGWSWVQALLAGIALSFVLYLVLTLPRKQRDSTPHRHLAEGD